MRGHVVLSALVDAVLAGPPDADGIVARCDESVEGLPELVVDALRALPAQLALGQATHREVTRALEAAFAPLHRAREEEEAEEDEPDPPRDPPTLCEYLDREAPHAFVARRFVVHPRAPVMAGAMPPIASVGELAARLGLTQSALEAFTHVRTTGPDPLARFDHYTRRFIPKRRGGVRLIERPKHDLRVAQRRLLDAVLVALPLHDAAHGFVRGRSPRSHAMCHARRDVVLTLDLEDFFTSVSRARVAGILRACGYSDEVAAAMSRLVTTRTPVAMLDAARSHEDRRRHRDAHLPQGAPSSPVLANAAARVLDARIAGLAKRLGLVYTRYADDMVLSGPSSLSRRADYVEARIASIAIDEGFRLQHRKTRSVPSSQAQRVTGLVVNDTPSVSRRERDRLEAILVQCVRQGPATQNRANVPDFRAHLAGRVAYVASVKPAHGDRLRALFSQVVW